MKHIPAVLLVIGLLIVVGFTVFFSIDLFVAKGTKISFDPVEALKDDSYAPSEEVQKQLMNILRGSEFYLVRDPEFNSLNKKEIDIILTEKKNALKTAPVDAQLLFELGYYSFLNHYDAQAISYLDKAHQQNPKDPSISLAKAYVLFKSKEVDKTKALLSDLEKQFPDNSDIILCKAIIFEKLKDSAQAKSYYTKVLQIDKRNLTAKKALVRLKEKN